MSCGQSESWMMSALDGTLLAPERWQLTAHLETCPQCRADWNGLNALEQMLHNPPLALPTPGFAGRVEARLDRFEAQRRTLVGGLILMGAATALCLLAVPWLLNGRNPIAAYAAFLRSAYDLLSYGALLSYKLVSALWLTLDTLASSADVSLVNLFTYTAGAVLAVAAWRRALTSQRVPLKSGRSGR